MLFTANRNWAIEPEVLVDSIYRQEKPTYSIVMPIHNQESIIRDVIRRLFINTYGFYEMFLILDGCTDGTKEAVLTTIKNPPANLCKIVVVSLSDGIFETSCDNLGFVNTTGKYIIEIQADMQVMTQGYNMLLTTPMQIYPDLIAVSGRCCHTLTGVFTGVGKLGSLVESPHVTSFQGMNQIHLSHTVNRGPLALRRSMLEELNYLDEKKFVLGDDEHDLFIRAWNQKRWRTAFYPVEVYSPLSWGTTRKSRPARVQAYLDSRTVQKPNYDFSTLPPYEVRTMTAEQQYQSMSL